MEHSQYTTECETALRDKFAKLASHGPLGKEAHRRGQDDSRTKRDMDKIRVARIDVGATVSGRDE